MYDKIRITGLLVDATYDAPCFAPDIERGIICPASHIISQLDERANDNEQIVIEIDSEGGDVFAFHSVANRIQAMAGRCKIILGAAVFSEAANLTILSGVKEIYAHRNTVVLFHSAMTEVYDAAATELRNEAEMIDAINAPIKKALAEYGIPQERIDKGFADRGALILGADELLEYGIVKGIVAAADEMDAVLQPETSLLAERLVALVNTNQRIAAHFSKRQTMSKKLNEKANSILARVKADDPAADPAEENEEQTTTTETPTDGEGSGETETPAEETPAEETPVETTTETEHPVDPSDPEPKKKTAEVEEEVVEETEEEVVDDSDLEDEVDELRQLVDDLIDRMENLQRQFDENVSAILKGKTAVKSSIAKALSGAPASNAPADWPSAIKDCNGDRLQAFKRFPNLAKVWNKNH